MQTNSQKQQILSSVKDFFDAESKSRKPKLCEHCTSSMEFFEAQFCLYGTSMTWKISVPFCPVCDQEASRSLHPIPAA